MNSRFFIAPATALAVLLVSGPAALALDANDFAAKFFASYNQDPSSDLTYNASSPSDGIVEISGMTMTMPDTDAPSTMPATLTFTGVTENGDGSYEAEAASVPDMAFTQEGVDVSIKNIRMTGIYVPATGNYETVDSLYLYEDFNAGPVAVAKDGQQTFSFDTMTAKNSANSDKSVLESSFALSGLHADLSAIDDPEAAGMLAAFELTSIDGKISGHGTWAVKDGNYALDELSVDLDKIGKLNVTAALTGLNLEFVQSMSKAQTKIAEMPIDARSDAEQAMFMQLMSQLAVGKLAIRFDDASITNKVLDMLAAQQGADRKVLAAGFAAMAPAMLAEIVPPELAGKIGEALTAYLTEPKNIEISATPESALGMADVMPVAEDPAALIKLLNVQVLANQ